MCGIAGFIHKDVRRPADPSVIENMCRIIAHRGPDDEGVFTQGPVGLGHRRLSILDLSEAGKQPMRSHDGHYVIIFNGEIYNYVELRRELSKFGCRFHTQTDTEVILEAYRVWGRDCVQRFNGMWAFALFDRSARQLFLSRDRFGIKPLYCLDDGESFVFASEIKAILAVKPGECRPRENYLARFLPGGVFDDGTETSFQNVWSILPAQNALYDVDAGKLEKWSYWSVDTEKFAADWKSDDPVAKMQELLESSIQLHMRSDVPVGTCLSGGLDSSAIACIMSQLLDKPIHTFSGIYADRDCNEEQFVNAVNAKTSAIPTPIHPEPNGDLLDDLRTITWHQDEPTAGPGLYTQYHVMREAGKKIKVILDGQGCDELFAGYLWYFRPHLQDFLARKDRIGAFKLLAGIWWQWGLTVVPGAFHEAAGTVPWAKKLATWWTGKPQPAAPALDVVHPRLKADLEKSPVPRAPCRIFPENLSIVQNDAITRSSIPALLHYEDRNSMAHSIEARVPFLDYRIVEFAYTVPNALKMNGTWTKWVVRKAAEKYLPAKVAWRRSKMGYPTPMARWLRSAKEKPQVEELLFSSDLPKRDVINMDSLRQLWNEHQAGKDHSWLLYRVITMELWHQMYVDNFAANRYTRPMPVASTPLRKSA